MENEIMTRQDEVMDLEISASELELLKEIARDGQTNFVRHTKDGLSFGDELFTEIYCQITDWDRYSYRWQEGKNKIIERELSKDEAKKLGFLDGMDLTLKVLRPEMENTFVMSLPQSSYWNFSKYAQSLLSKNMTPKHVITKIRSTLKQFKKGGPVAVCLFEAVGVIQQKPEPVVNVTPQKVEPAPQEPISQDIPSEWA